MKKIYVFDTSVLVTDPNCLFSFENNDIIIPFKVIEEFDNQKKRQDVVGANARAVSRILDELRSEGSLFKGVKLAEGSRIFVRTLKNKESTKTADDEIIQTALEIIEEQKESGSKRKVILVSRDINVRIKCDALNIDSEDYNPDKVVGKLEEIYDGATKIVVKDEVIDDFYLGKDIVFKDKKDIFPNEFIVLTSSANEKKTAIVRFLNYGVPLKKIPEYKKGIMSISPKNKEQVFALDLLLDQSIDLVTLIGGSGVGKSILSLAAALSQIDENGRYNRLIIARPFQPMGKDIGYLPGDELAKSLPWMKPIYDNLEFLMKGNKDALKMHIEHGIIEIEPLTYIRGRSISNAIFIIDEGQQLNSHEMKAILTRAGENTKIIITGDIEQIDSPYLNEVTSGLTYVVEKFKDYDLAGHVTLKKGERSRLASLASKIL